jgi:hypothetical protein
LWGWYTPTLSAFDPTDRVGPSEAVLGRLAARAGLRFFVPYATGGAPWYRITGPGEPRIQSMTLFELRAAMSLVGSLRGRVEVPPFKHAEAMTFG